MDKWEKLKQLINADLSWNVHYSFERPVEHDNLHRVLKWMKDLEASNDSSGFLFTDIPEFDKSTWKRMIKELQGLS